jgi:hypothetical protein
LQQPNHESEYAGYDREQDCLMPCWCSGWKKKSRLHGGATGSSRLQYPQFERGRNMERLLNAIVVFALVALFVGCGSDKDRNVNKDKDKPQTQKDADK